MTITPDFPRSGAIARAMVLQNFGIKVDGVVSVDPVALGYLLGGTGPVELKKDVVLDQNNVVGTLLNLVYANIKDPELQDDFFALANRRIFNTFKKGEGDASAVLSAIVRGVDENRIMFWASRKAEQKQLEPTPLSGAFTTDDGKTPHVGVYLSDAASTKMEYYLDFDTSIAVGQLPERRAPGHLHHHRPDVERAGRSVEAAQDHHRHRRLRQARFDAPQRPARLPVRRHASPASVSTASRRPSAPAASAAATSPASRSC